MPPAPRAIKKRRTLLVLRRVRDLLLLTGLSFWRGFQGFYSSDNLTYAASIAYYGLLSLFPFALLSFALLSRVTADVEDRSAVLDFVLRYFPKQFEFITAQIDALQGRSITLGVVGTIGIVWGSLGVFGAISTAVNYAWGVEKTRSFWKHKLFSFLMLSVAGLMLMLALLLVSASHVVGASWFASVTTRWTTPWCAGPGSPSPGSGPDGCGRATSPPSGSRGASCPKTPWRRRCSRSGGWPARG